MGMAIIYGLKVNLSVTVVAMINATALEELANAEANVLGTANDATGHDHGMGNGTVHDEIDPDDMCFDPNAKADPGTKNEVSGVICVQSDGQNYECFLSAGWPVRMDWTTTGCCPWVLLHWLLHHPNPWW